MSWSVTINDVPGTERFDLDLQEHFASLHPAYPRDMDAALAFAKAVGLKSATLTGMRTPNPYGGDEIVDISVRGFPTSNDFIAEMREIIKERGEETPAARHYQALAILRSNPHPHIWNDSKECVICGVHTEGGLLEFRGLDGLPGPNFGG